LCIWPSKLTFDQNKKEPQTCIILFLCSCSLYDKLCQNRSSYSWLIASLDFWSIVKVFLNFVFKRYLRITHRTDVPQGVLLSHKLTGLWQSYRMTEPSQSFGKLRSLNYTFKLILWSLYANIYDKIGPAINIYNQIK